jgi:Cu-Zn family superoxide dismutase
MMAMRVMAPFSRTPRRQVAAAPDAGDAVNRLRTPALALAAAATLGACGTADDPALDAGSTAGDTQAASFALKDSTGAEKGTIEVAFTEDGASLTVTATGLPPGLHGMHVHKVGRCEADSADPTAPEKKGAFLSAGGHLAEQGQTHGDHDGDLPSLLVREDGTATLSVASDRLTRDAVLDGDGSALMVHADRDNFANVPDRYAPALDDTTKKTGDAGVRIACAPLTG